jgi:subtilase family serine protease
MTYTLGFNATRGAANQAQITVDPRNIVSEKNETNNAVIIPIRAY